MYKSEYSVVFTAKLKKLRKSKHTLFIAVMKKIGQILENPNHAYKFLHHDLKGFQRTHIQSYVLVFRSDHEKKIISFEDIDHHDNIYQ